MSNFPSSYRLSWLPRHLAPSLAGVLSDRAQPLRTLFKTQSKPLRLVFLGDLSGEANRRAPVVDPSLRDRLAAADLIVANCESPVVETPSARLATRLGFKHAMTSPFLRGALDAAGIDPKRLVLSLANNHALDQGVEGFDETVAALAGAGIRICGTRAGGLVSSTTLGPLTIGLIAFTVWWNADVVPFESRVLTARDMAAERRGKDIPSPAADLTIGLPHWGWEFRHFPNPETVGHADVLGFMGASLVVGGHQHVIQPMGMVLDTPVAYGLGDFLGTAWRRVRWPLKIAAMLEVDVSVDPETRGRIAGWEMVPFFRLTEGDKEMLVPIDRLDGTLRNKVEARLAAVLGPTARAS